MYHLVISYLKTKKLLLYLLNFLGHSHWLFFKVWYTSITIVWVMVDLQYEVNDHNGFKHVGTQWNLSLNSCSANFPVYTLDSCTNIPHKNRLQNEEFVVVHQNTRVYLYPWLFQSDCDSISSLPHSYHLSTCTQAHNVNTVHIAVYALFLKLLTEFIFSWKGKLLQKLYGFFYQPWTLYFTSEFNCESSFKIKG